MAAQQGDAYVVIDPAKLAEFMRSPSGPVLRDLLEKGERVKEEAKRLVGVSQPDPVPRRKPGRRPGTLRDSIVKRVADVGGQPAVIIVAEDKIAFWHHEGTEPHPISARNAPNLVFYWPKIGRIMVTRSVNHPGTKPNRFLVNALRVIGGSGA